MSDHEQLHTQAEQEADRLEQENERVGKAIEDAKDARDRAAGDDFVATPGTGERANPGDPVGDLAEIGDSFGGDGPPPEIRYTDKE
jgi:hypothetical protein